MLFLELLKLQLVHMSTMLETDSYLFILSRWLHSYAINCYHRIHWSLTDDCSKELDTESSYIYSNNTLQSLDGMVAIAIDSYLTVFNMYNINSAQWSCILAVTKHRDINRLIHFSLAVLNSHNCCKVPQCLLI